MSSKEGVTMDYFRVGFAVVVVLAFGVFAYFLVENADTTEEREWERWVFVFGAVEAVAFTAIGWVFGREVNRERAENAEERAQTAEEEKVQERDRGAKLAGMVVAESGGAPPPGQPRLESQPSSGGGATSAAEFARREYGL
jgi:hypothetical protein